MCGIAGCVNNFGLDIARNDVAAMLSAIQHRGPDAMGLYIDGLAAIGHVRLSIIDLAGGDQPISNEDKTIWVTYNGEIYNFPELRDELLGKGHHFSTGTDTEILVHLYEEEGTGFLDRLNGQWAFAIWDTRKKRLFCARDRVGVRPLYYTMFNNTFIFASEIKALFALPGIGRTVDPSTLDDIFTFWAPLPGKTFFHNISELLPGHFLLFDKNGIKTGPYWEIPLYSRDEWFTDSPDVLSENLRDLLVDAVRIRLRSDVPVGTYLSGGLDSSGITAIVSQRFNPGVETFGIRFNDERFDEGKHQQEMVHFLKVAHHEIMADTTAITDSFTRAIRHCEKPILRTAPVPLYLLAKLVRQNSIKVVLTGEGADEFFGGYDIFKEALVRTFWGRFPQSIQRGKLIERLYPDIFRDDRTRKVVKSFFGRNIESFRDPFFSHNLRWNNTSRIKTFFSDELNSTLQSYDARAALEKHLPPKFSSRHILARAQHLEIMLFMSNYLLSSQGDRMGMAHSVEVRMPFLDHRLMEFVGKVPTIWKICGLHEKHLLKKALVPFLPGSITGRVKHPYRAPVHESLFILAQNEEGRELLSERAVRQAGLFDYNKICTLLSKLRKTEAASETDSMALAGIISAQSIVRDFIEESPLKQIVLQKPDRVIEG